MSEKVIPLVVQPKYNGKLDFDFLRHIILSEVSLTPFTYSNKGGKTRLGRVSVSIPIKEDGEYDMEAQKEIAQLFETKEQKIRELEMIRDKINAIDVKIDLLGYHLAYKKVSDIFSISRGNGIYTKSYANIHRGQIPLFSGNTTGPFMFVDVADYDMPCLSWTIDGLAGYIMTHTSAFSATNHRGILLPKTKSINLQYAKYAMQPIFRSAKKGRVGDNGKNEYTSLPPFMVQNLQIPFPVDENGNISMTAQEEIAEKYILVDQCKHEVVSKLDQLIQQKISI